MTPRLLAQLSALASREADAALDPFRQDDYNGRYAPIRVIGAADVDESEHFLGMCRELGAQARAAGWQGGDPWAPARRTRRVA